MIHFSYLPTSKDEIPPRVWFKGKAPNWRETSVHNVPWLVLLTVVIARALGFLF